MGSDWHPVAFATGEPLETGEMLAAAWRSPKLSALQKGLGLRGDKERAGAAALGLQNVGDLIEHLPSRHEDRGDVRPISAIKTGEDASIAVEVRSLTTRRSFGGRKLVRTVATVADESGPLEVTWFNQPWIERQVGEGTRLVIHGRLESRGRFRAVEHEFADGVTRLAEGLVPVHPAADGLSPKRIRRLAATHRSSIPDVIDPLPVRLIAGAGLPARADALDCIHFPSSIEAERRARERLAFDELLLVQLDLLRRRALREGGSEAPKVDSAPDLSMRWLEGLPFSPTAGQLGAIGEIDADLARSTPMTRLLMGDVGAGKTVVAFHALLRAVESGGQGLLMAPTETLAVQHMASAERLLADLNVPFALLTGSTPAPVRRNLLDRLQSGELPLLIGTHALLEPDVVAPRLMVCVVDEQHRFGVRQRERLAAAHRGDGLVPHMLHMTATPIPRTLALAAYGDVDTSALRELPAGRTPIETHVVAGEAARRRAYERIREEVAEGGRAFVVCPLVEVSEATEAKAATDERDRLANGPLSGLRVGLLHGRMTPAEKSEAMGRFAQGDCDVLVSTTVIEVGIDVPEATVMLVEDAERFGLAQLHQLRGRVGRGSRPGLCLLVGRPDARRLVAMTRSTDGFALAELDLELRGEGELAGVRQSGLPTFRAARLPADLELLEMAHREAERLVATDPGLTDPSNSLLAVALKRTSEGAGDERIAA